MKRKIISAVLAVCMCLGAAVALTACDDPADDGKKTIVCTIFPQYDWVKQILGDDASNFKITYLLGSGVDAHSYNPSPADIAAVSACDLFIYVGGESDEWVEEINVTNDNQAAVAISDLVTTKEEEIKEGMEEEPGEEEEEGAFDEHVWLSLKNAQIIVTELAKEIGKLDTAKESVFAANAAAYNAKLGTWDSVYSAAVEASSRNTILVADRFPFRYLVDDYGIDYYAAFPGCYAASEASPATIAFLTDKAKDFKAIITLETSDKKIANSIRTNQEVLTLHACQSVTMAEISGGLTYLSVMMQNLEILTRALAA